MECAFLIFKGMWRIWAIIGGTQTAITPPNKLKVENGEFSKLFLVQNNIICTKKFGFSTLTFYSSASSL